MMNTDAKKSVLRMIPYGIYVLTADDGRGNICAATVNWVTQTAFAPPLLVVGVKTDFGLVPDRQGGAGPSRSICWARTRRASLSRSSARRT